MYINPNELINRIRTLGSVNWRMRHKIAWAIIRQYDNIIGLKWIIISPGKYILWGVNCIENHKYIEIYDNPAYNHAFNLTKTQGQVKECF